MAVQSNVIKQLESLLARKSSVIEHKRNSWKYEGKWLRAGNCHYISGDRTERVWEMTERTTKQGIDGVDILAINNDKLLSLVAIYRPPVDKISIEFPAGLINNGEDPSLAAIRELKEETGQNGICKSVSSAVLYTDPWKSNESSVVCQMTVTEEGHDLSLDEDEYLEHFKLPLKGLLNSLNTLQTQFDIIIEAKLYLFALGMEIGKELQ